MANFLRRLVAKSRSSSPQKGHQGAPPAANQYPANLDISEDLVVEEECCWAGPSSVTGQSTNLMMSNHHVPSTSNRHHHHHQTRGGPADGTALGIASHFQMNSLAKAVPNHVGNHHHQHHPPSPTSNRRQWSPPPPLPAVRATTSNSSSSKLPMPPQSPSSAAALRRHQFFGAPQLYVPDEPGTSSQEQLLSSPSSLFPPNSPSSWAQRNSHSNLESAASGSQRPSSTLPTGLAEISSLATGHYGPTMGIESGRPRSTSPRKGAAAAGGAVGVGAGSSGGSRSRSPPKKSTAKKGGGGEGRMTTASKTLDYLQPQCRLEGCSAIILVEDTRFLVCKHQLSHSSDFFRTLFLNSHALPMEGVRHVRQDEYVVQVSSLRHPPQALQFQWFLETTVPSPMLRDISDDLLETCMRLCKRFAARGLEMRCTKFIKDNVELKPPLMALCWLNWSFKHHFHRTVQEACLPVVARLSLCQLEKHRQMLPEGVFADLLAMKLRTSYQQASSVFHTIHRMDHFYVDVAQCPRCGRQREQGRVRVQASPCHKLVGCERCMREYQCELGEDEASGSNLMQAFWQCEHGLWPFSEKTEDCQCQTALYKANWASGGGGDDLARRTNSNSNRPPPTNVTTGGGGGATAAAAAGRFPSNLTLASTKPSHSSKS